MNKKELVRAISEDTGKYQKDIAVIVDSLLEVVGNTIASGEEVLLQGFGKFGVTTRIPRNVKNPITGEIMQIGETKNVKFTQGTDLKNKL